MMILWVVLTVCKCSPHPYVAVPHTTTHLPKPHMVSIYGRCTPCVRPHLKPRCTLHTTTPPTPLIPQPINETSVTQNTTNPINQPHFFWRHRTCPRHCTQLQRPRTTPPMQVWNRFYCQNSTKCPQRPWLPYMETTPPYRKTSNRIHSQPFIWCFYG